MSKKTKTNRKAQNRVAIFYKSHGEYIGPYNGITFSQRQISDLQRSGTLNFVSNYVLRSPLQLRKWVA